MQRGDEWETTPVAALNTFCQGATLTFRAVVKPEDSCSVVWQDEAGKEIGSSDTLKHSFPNSTSLQTTTLYAFCKGSSSLEKKTVSIAFIQNSHVTVSAEGGYQPPTPKLSACSPGAVAAEDMELNVNACLTDGQWNARLDDLNGMYSSQSMLVPPASDVNGNTTQNNFCQQVKGLLGWGLNNGSCDAYEEQWNSLEAVQAHERVHEQDMLPALESAIPICQQSVENNLKIDDTVGMTPNMAGSLLNDIHNGIFKTIKGWCIAEWGRISKDMGDKAHECRTRRAERPFYNQRISEICTLATEKGWRTLEPENCLECTNPPLALPICD